LSSSFFHYPPLCINCLFPLEGTLFTELGVFFSQRPVSVRANPYPSSNVKYDLLTPRPQGLGLPVCALFAVVIPLLLRCAKIQSPPFLLPSAGCPFFLSKPFAPSLPFTPCYRVYFAVSPRIKLPQLPGHSLSVPFYSSFFHFFLPISGSGFHGPPLWVKSPSLPSFEQDSSARTVHPPIRLFFRISFFPDFFLLLFSSRRVIFFATHFVFSLFSFAKDLF